MNARQKRVLVVDDDPITRITLSEVLSRDGFETLLADSGEAGLGEFRQQLPDLVLLDVMLPGIDGIEACRLMRSARADQTPILMLTSLNDVGSVEGAFDAGATDFITKPLNFALLSQRIRYALRTRDMYDAMQLQQQRLRRAQELARLGYWEMSPNGDSITLSDELLCMLKLADGEGPTVPLQRFSGLICADDRAAFLEQLRNLAEGRAVLIQDQRLVLDDGSEIIAHQQAEALLDQQSRVEKLVGILQDITAQHKAESLIEFQRLHDYLTGLPNRQLFTTHLRQIFNASDQAMATIGILGIDRLEHIRQGHGHLMVEDLIIAFAQRLKRLLPQGAFLGRLDSGLFALAMACCKSVEQVELSMKRVQDGLNGNYLVHNEPLFVQTSIGLVFYPEDGEKPDDLLKKAESAMFMARSRVVDGYQISLYSSDIISRIRHRMVLEKDLNQAIEQDQLQLYFQPQFDLGSGRIIGAEALIRWWHPELGYISPLELIQIAEESSLIIPLGQWVARRAMQQWIEACVRLDDASMRLAINVSARQLQDATFTETICGYLRASELDPAQLEIEITETQMLEDIELVPKVLAKLRVAGVVTVIDDFGTGYCSLSYIHRLPIAGIKIDRAFLCGLEDDRNRGLVRAIVAMSQSLGLKVLAEGIEEDRQWRFLRELGCQEGQGYLVGKPVPLDEFIEQVRHSRALAD